MARAPSIPDRGAVASRLREEAEKGLAMAEAFGHGDQARYWRRLLATFDEHTEVHVDRELQRLHSRGCVHELRSAAVMRPARRVSRPRARRERRHVARSTSGSDSGDDGPASPASPRRRRVVVDRHYVVQSVVVA